MKNTCLNILLFLSFAIIISSCSSQKRVIYFQKDSLGSDTMKVAQDYVPTIRPGDLLSIYVTSLSSAASSYFNPYSGGGADPATPGATQLAQSTTPGFLVDADGKIELPLVGLISVGGQTTAQARDVIKEKLKTYLKEPTVNVRFLNYKISIVGEVTRPSVYVIPNEKVTLPEAIAMAGDLTIFAKRENILIVRDNGGKKEFGRVNLNNREVFTSPYYYLHSGDLIYIEQGKAKAAQTDQTYRILPIVLSALTVVGLLISRLKL